jgi:hypothetical protein
VGVDGHDANPESERNVISGNESIGVAADHGAVIAGNYIGTDASGTRPLGNNTSGQDGGAGIALGDDTLVGSDGDGVGDDCERNVISANFFGGESPGIAIEGSGNQIAGNLIGTGATGSFGLGQQGVGVAFSGSSQDNVLGYDSQHPVANPAAQRNVISGNISWGVVINGQRNVIAGNFIGTDLNGTASVGNGTGITFSGGSSNRVGTGGDGFDDLERNIISGNFFGGVGFRPAGDYNVLAGNYIGLDATGMHSLDNAFSGGYGTAVSIYQDSDGGGVGNQITGNVISTSYHGDGINILDFGYSLSQTVIADNLIGTDASGRHTTDPGPDGIYGTADDVPLGCQNGIYLRGPGVTGTLIQGNLIGACQQNAIAMDNGLGGAGPTGTRIVGNWIGTDPQGDVFPDNGTGVILIRTTSSQIGGPAPGDGNTIASSGGAGVAVVVGSTGNVIQGNSIHDNAIGIALGTDVWQDPPALSVAYSGGSTEVHGTLHSTPCTTFTLDFYASAAVDRNGNVEGRRYLGSYTTRPADEVSPGVYSFIASGLAASSPGELITATATAPGGNTSQFSPGVPAIPVFSSLSGVVFSDFNDDGQVDFGEQGIPNVQITLTGTDDLGHAVGLSQTTDADGTYVFLNLRPGSYTITETQQPAGYTPGVAAVGTGGGTASGQQFAVTLAPDEDAMNYNFGEIPAATGPIRKGQTAGIGFWNNRNGQALIDALNGGPASTQLGSWLAATFPHMFGAESGGNNLAGECNAYVAALFQKDFVVKDQKLDAQVLATALAVYVTDPTLDGTGVGAQYGFIVAGNGVATSTYNVGPNGAAFGVADNATMTVMDLLLAVDAQAVNGVLYNGNAARRNMANNVFSAINQAGGI